MHFMMLILGVLSRILSGVSGEYGEGQNFGEHWRGSGWVATALVIINKYK